MYLTPSAIVPGLPQDPVATGLPEASHVGRYPDRIDGAGFPPDPVEGFRQ